LNRQLSPLNALQKKTTELTLENFFSFTSKNSHKKAFYYCIKCNMNRDFFRELLLSARTNQPSQQSALYRLAKMHRMPYLWRSFSAKEPRKWWLFCGK